MRTSHALAITLAIFAHGFGFADPAHYLAVLVAALFVLFAGHMIHLDRRNQ